MKKQKDNTTQDQDSEIEEDDQDFQQKQLEIDELNKKMRYMELDFKKKEIEINAELGNERQRAEELQDIVSKKLAFIKENKEADELQNKLSLVEDELFEKQQIAHEMLRQLTDMEQENDYLKNEVDRLRNSSPSQNHNQDIDVDKIVNKCMELQKENSELEMEVEQIKRGAIDTIVEKEKVILDLQEQIEMLSQEMKNMDENLHQSSNLILQEEEIENLRNEYEQRIQMYEERYQELNQRIEQEQLQHDEQLLNLEQQITERVFENMQSHIDSAKSMEADLMHQLQFLEEKTRNQDKLYQDSQKHHQNTRDEFKKEKEQQEQKIRNLTKQADQFEETNRLHKQIVKEFEEYRKQSEREVSEKLTQIEKITSKRDEQMKVQVNLESENKRLKENLENCKQNIRSLEQANEQLQEQLEDSQRDIHFKIKELTQQFEKEKFALMEENQSQVGAVQRKSSTGTRKYSNYTTDFVKQNSTQQAVAAAAVATTAITTTSRKNSSALSNNVSNADKLVGESNTVLLNSGNTIQVELQQQKDDSIHQISPESSGKKSQASDRNSNAKQTLLGLEFEDEDFSIEEEEKTDNIDRQSAKEVDFNTQEDKLSTDFDQQNQESFSSIQDTPETKNSYHHKNNTNSTPRKKKQSFNIVESQINPLLPQRNSTRNQFKKQFLLPQQQSQQQQNQQLNSQQQSVNQNQNANGKMLSNDQIVRGYNLENINIQDLVNENIDLKMKIQKLECSVSGLEVMIEKLQNESKQTLKQLQEYRKEKVLTNKEADLINELNSFKAHCHRVETQFVTQKLQLTEELHFYKEEIRIFEKLANEHREQLVKLSQDKDYFQQKYTKLKSILKQRRTGGSLGGTSLFPENYEIPQQQQQKKKTFWIFK